MDLYSPIGKKILSYLHIQTAPHPYISPQHLGTWHLLSIPEGPLNTEYPKILSNPRNYLEETSSKVSAPGPALPTTNPQKPRSTLLCIKIHPSTHQVWTRTAIHRPTASSAGFNKRLKILLFSLMTIYSNGISRPSNLQLFLCQWKAHPQTRRGTTMYLRDIRPILEQRGR
jgi:hypothetical protein